MNKQFLKDTFFWGVILWLIGYILGIMLFAFIPTSLIGWVIMPIGLLITIWVLAKKIPYRSVPNMIIVGLIWALLAIVLDYFLLVKLFKPKDGYYKLDVYLYYFLTFVLPIVYGWQKQLAKK